MNQKRTLLTLSLALLLALTACGGHQEDTAPTESVDTPAVTEPAEDASLTALREEMSARNCHYAIAYLGSTQGTTLEKVLAENPYNQDYPFLADAEVVVQEGNQLYLLVPELGSSLTVYDLNSLEDSTVPTGLFYQGGDQPVILLCNVSDLTPNTMVSITLADGSQPQDCVFTPCLSACDGTIALPSGASAYDFSRITAAPSQEALTSSADFLGDWQTIVLQNGTDVICELHFDQYGTMSYLVGYPNSEWMDIYDGTYYIVENSAQSPAGAVVFELTSSLYADSDPFWGVFAVTNHGSDLLVEHISGTALLYGFENQVIDFVPIQ